LRLHAAADDDDNDDAMQVRRHARNFIDITHLALSWKPDRTLGRGGDLGGTGGIVPLKKLGEGDGSAFIPPIFRKCLSDLQCKND